MPKQRLSKSLQAAVIAVMEALKARGCISSYTLDAPDSPEWTEDGFDIAFQEFQLRPRQPFGLRKSKESAWFMIVLARKDKEAVDAFILDGWV